ncbi:MAG TPA: hypothetical protein VG963_16280 [Polyangiaceae bacterium]|nr:hypothetical protein [Polyangiaceae bacterium]
MADLVYPSAHRPEQTEEQRRFRAVCGQHLGFTSSGPVLPEDLEIDQLQERVGALRAEHDRLVAEGRELRAADQAAHADYCAALLKAVAGAEKAFADLSGPAVQRVKNGLESAKLEARAPFRPQRSYAPPATLVECIAALNRELQKRERAQAARDAEILGALRRAGVSL